MIQFGNDKIKEIYVGSDKIKEVYHGADLVWSGKKPSYAILTNGTRVDFELENTPIANFCTTGRGTSSITVNGTSIVKNIIKEIVFGSSYSGVTSINNNFLRSLVNLDSLDLSSLNNITTVGDYFLRSTNLPSYDLNHLIPLSNVTRVGNYFLYDCLAVTSIDLSPLSKLTSIPERFLCLCTALTSVDFSSLSNISYIGFNFLNSCDLRSVDLSSLTNLNSISYNFLASNPRLGEFKIGAVNVPTLGSNAFNDTHTSLAIKVPSQSVNAYKAATNWINYASKISAI